MSVLREICGECKYNERDFQSHRIAVMQSFVVATRIATITEYRLCMTIVAMILKKKNESEE